MKPCKGATRCCRASGKNAKSGCFALTGLVDHLWDALPRAALAAVAASSALGYLVSPLQGADSRLITYSPSGPAGRRIARDYGHSKS